MTSTNTGYYRITMNKYTPGSFAQTIQDATWILYSDGVGRNQSDLQYMPLTGNLLVGANSNSPGGSSISIVTADSGQVLRVSTVTFAFTFQIARGPDNVYYVTNDTSVNSINPNTGALNSGTSFGTILGTADDAAEYLSQPC